MTKAKKIIDRVSMEPTPWAVLCSRHSLLKLRTRFYLTQDEYFAQMDKPDDRWLCPMCGHYAEFDDDNYEKQQNFEVEDG